MKRQDNLRKQVKVAKACNDWITYKDLAEAIEITYNSFCNWLNRSYCLSENKARLLQDIVVDLIDID